jgi:hypothetical protein
MKLRLLLPADLFLHSFIAISTVPLSLTPFKFERQRDFVFIRIERGFEDDSVAGHIVKFYFWRSIWALAAAVISTGRSAICRQSGGVQW